MVESSLTMTVTQNIQLRNKYIESTPLEITKNEELEEYFELINYSDFNSFGIELNSSKTKELNGNNTIELNGSNTIEFILYELNDNKISGSYTGPYILKYISGNSKKDKYWEETKYRKIRTSLIIDNTTKIYKK